MDANEESVEELLRRAEAWANEHKSKDDHGPGRRIDNEEAKRLIAKGFVDIWPIWHVLVAMKDEPLAWAIGSVWIPSQLLDGDVDPEDLTDEEGRYQCVLRSRLWFDEDKLMPDDTMLVHSAISIVVLMCRTIDSQFGSWLKRQMMGDADDSDS